MDESVNFASMMMLQTMFPDLPDHQLETALLMFEGDVDKSRQFLEKRGYKMNEITKEAMKIKPNVATKETITASSGMLALQVISLNPIEIRVKIHRRSFLTWR